MTGDPFDNYGADIKAKAAADELERLRAALNYIAAWDDRGANERLKITGSYAEFDEPNAVATARDALK
ncbi:MAG: hypothetical protein GY807_24005 [Gammaproteobacteria bacterium]|nr:hypothetical protein [Gammaproteobacteria bacterium]